MYPKAALPRASHAAKLLGSPPHYLSVLPPLRFLNTFSSIQQVFHNVRFSSGANPRLCREYGLVPRQRAP